MVVVQGGDADCTSLEHCRNEYTSDRKYFRNYWNLTEIPVDIPAEAEHVQLIYNAITHIPLGVFKHLSQCVYLNLRANQISIIKPEMFTRLYKLETLGLGVNKITSIEDRSFDSLFSLGLLNIRLNRLRTLSPSLLSNTPRKPLVLATRYFRQTNPWNCSSLCWMKHEEQHKTVVWYEGNTYPGCADGSDWKTFECGQPGESMLGDYCTDFL